MHYDTEHQQNSRKQKEIARQGIVELERRKKQKHRQILCITSVIIVLLILVAILVVCLKSCFGGIKTDNSANAVLNGTYVYDQYTEYEFDGKSAGCMCLESSHFPFTYVIDGDKLNLDFEDSAVHDCGYTFTLNENTLTIVGNEGTTGGTYSLTKK